MHLLRLISKTCAREKDSEFDKLLTQDKTRLGLCKQIPCMFYDGVAKVGEGTIVDVEMHSLYREYFILHECDLEMINDWVNCFDDDTKYNIDIGMMSTYDPEKAMNGNVWDRNVVIFQTKLKLPRQDYSDFADWIHRNYCQFGKVVPTEAAPADQLKAITAFQRILPANFDAMSEEDKQKLRDNLKNATIGPDGKLEFNKGDEKDERQD